MKNPCKECIVKVRCMDRKMSELLKECYLLEDYIIETTKSRNINKLLQELVLDLKCKKTI